MRQLGIAAYLRNLSIRINQIARTCLDPKTKAALDKICVELTDKAEAIEALFAVQPTH